MHVVEAQSKLNAILLSRLGAMLCMRWPSSLALVCALALVGCDANHPVNAPIASQDLAKGYRLQRVKADPDNPGDVLVILTLSGGGTRAAALAYGTMEALRDVKLRMGSRSRRLLDEVDVINAVSGGSIVAAYYAVHRDGLFRDFEAWFLKRDVERQLRIELPANLICSARQPGRSIAKTRTFPSCTKVQCPSELRDLLPASAHERRDRHGAYTNAPIVPGGLRP